MAGWRARMGLFSVLTLAGIISGAAFGSTAQGGPVGEVAAAEGAPAASSQPAEGAPAPPSQRAELRIYYTNPVLVRAGERVRMPVDVVCSVGGDSCSANVSLVTRVPGEPWRVTNAPSSPYLQFDLTGPASRAVRAGDSGFVEFYIRARGPGGAIASLGGPEPGRTLRFFVVRALPVLAIPEVPFGGVRHGRVELFLPWGTGAMRAGLALGNESATIGPPSFDVDGLERIHLADALQDRVAIFRSGRLSDERKVRLSARAAVAAGPNGDVHVVDGSGQSVMVRSLGPEGSSGAARTVGSGLPSEVQTVGSRLFVRLLPLDAWVHPSAPGGQEISVGLPGPSGAQLVRIGRESSLRVAIVRADGAVDGFELTSDHRLGEVALSRPDGRGGFVVVVRVVRELPSPADQFQILHLRDGRFLATFAAPSHDFAQALPLGKFRIGPGMRLHQMVSSPDGVRIVRFDLGGTS